MEAEIRILEIFPKLKLLKNNIKDIISIFFISDNYSVKLENVEKSINNKEKILLNLNESKNKKISQLIKCSLLRNNNIIGKGEFIPSEGLKWYDLNDTKNNTFNKDSQISSYTSTSNIKNLKYSYISSNINNNKLHISPDISNLIYNNDKSNLRNSNNQINNSTISSIIKIKLLINLLHKRNKNYINHYDLIKSNNYTKEPSQESSKLEENIKNQKEDIFKENTLTVHNLEINNEKPKNKITTKSKNIKNRKKFGKTTFPSRIFAKKNLNLNKNQIVVSTGNSINNSRTLHNTANNSKIVSSKYKNGILNTKQFFNEDEKMKTANGFYKIKDEFENKEKIKKINSCDNIEDEIIDESFKDNLKNDEILKVNLSRNNSYSSLTLNNTHNTNNSNRTKKNIQKEKIANILYTDNRNFIPSTTRINNIFLNNNVIKNIFPTNINNNINNYFSLNTNYDCNNNGKSNPNIFNRNNKFTDVISKDVYDNFENMKNDLILLYPNDYSNRIKDEDAFLEIQLMIEKILGLQYEHQKKYIFLYNSINLNKKISNNYQNLYISFLKKTNKLHIKKIFQNIIDTKRELYNENIKNFITVRKKILNKDEFLMWNKMSENSNKSISLNNKKNKMINIFLNICGKNENSLNMLALKFYKEIKNKQLRKSPLNKKLKLKNNLHLSAKNISNVKNSIRDNDNELNVPLMKTNHKPNNSKLFNVGQFQNDNKSKYKNSFKGISKVNIFNPNDSKNNNYITLINEKLPNENVHKSGRASKCKNKSTSIIGKIYNRIKDNNKNQY